MFFEAINFAFLFVRFSVGYLWLECRVTLTQFKDRFYLVVFEEVRFNLSENVGKTCNILISLSASWVKAFSASASDSKSYNMEFCPIDNKDRFRWIEFKVKYFLHFVLEKI